VLLEFYNWWQRKTVTGDLVGESLDQKKKQYHIIIQTVQIWDMYIIHFNVVFYVMIMMQINIYLII